MHQDWSWGNLDLATASLSSYGTSSKPVSALVWVSEP